MHDPALLDRIIRNRLTFKMHPEDAPWLFLIRIVAVPPVPGNTKGIRPAKVVFFVLHLDNPPAFRTVDQDILVCALFPLPVVLLCLRKETHIRKVRSSDQRMLHIFCKGLCRHDQICFIPESFCFADSIRHTHTSFSCCFLLFSTKKFICFNITPQWNIVHVFIVYAIFTRYVLCYP